jgi:hypothetical protein
MKRTWVALKVALLLGGALLGFAGCSTGEVDCPGPGPDPCRRQCEQRADSGFLGMAGLVAPQDEETVRARFLRCLDDCARNPEREVRWITP